jgi:hypothetical protein
MRLLFTVLVLLLATLICQGTEPTDQSEKSRNSSEKCQREVNPLPSLPGTGNARTTKPNSSEKQNDTNNMLDHWKTPIDIITTAMIAMFTALTYFNLRSQLRATKIGERAWLVSNIGSIEETKVKGTFQVICKIKNNGRTPAWVTAAGSVGLIRNSEKELPKTPPYTHMGPFSRAGSVLPPTGWLPQGFPLTNEQLREVVKGKQTIFLTGFVTYRDIYKIEHRTTYCYQLKPAQDLTIPNPLDFFIAGPPDYNDAT